MARFSSIVFITLAILLAHRATAFENTADLNPAIETIRQVGPDSKGSAAAAKAWRVVSKTEAAQLVDVLTGMDGTNSLARNWLRAAVDEILERARQEQKSIPVEALESFVRDVHHDAQARRLAYELIVERDRTASERFLPQMLDDPSPDLRRDAVGRLLEQAEKAFQSTSKSAALPIYKKCLAAARDKKQIDKVAGRLQELGEAVDVPTQLGFIMDWKLLGPFPNIKQKGIDTVYPPETKVNLGATYEGKNGKIQWQNYVTQSNEGIVDLYAGLGKHPEGTEYAMSEFTSAAGGDVEIRLGCFTVFKLWVNGAMVLERGDAYTGMSFDHYVAKVRLRPGKNILQLKMCRDVEMPQAPNIWQFQLRICDETGAGIRSTSRPPRAALPKKS